MLSIYMLICCLLLTGYIHSRQIFAGYVSEEPVAEDTPLAKIRERRERLNALAAASSTVLPGSGSETH